MNKVETFTLEGVGVSVEETTDALDYRFVRPEFVPSVSPIGFVFVLVLCPLARLAFVVYARSKVAGRPEWKDVLTGVLAAQLLVWLFAGTVQCAILLCWVYRPLGIVWCAAMLAGLFASAQTIIAAGSGVPFLIGHGLLGFVHLALLVSHIESIGKREKRPDAS